VKIEILELAKFDLLDGYYFYEKQQPGLGSYFLASIYSDIESLRLYAGMHLKPHKNHHRLLSKRFPFAVYYKVSNATAFVHAVVDCRRDPGWIQERLQRD
jgi:hypothetical protein